MEIKVTCQYCNSRRIYPTLVYGYVGEKPLISDKQLYKCRHCGMVQHFDSLNIRI